jgi:competence protein ComEA
MDRSATPWRVLDDNATPAPVDQSGEPDASPGGWLTSRLLIGLASAATLAAAAFIVAASGPVGSVDVGGAATWASDAPAASGDVVVAGGVLVVDVQGAVLRPGVQRLKPGARVGDAVAAAGGYGPRVDADRVATELNLAAPVQDGDRIVVPARGDPTATSGGGSGVEAGSDAGGGLVDLNSASASELDALPGIGPKTAQKILDARAERRFATVDDLRDRKIVGAATFEKLKTLVTVR